jgi:hypothetical protein
MYWNKILSYDIFVLNISITVKNTYMYLLHVFSERTKLIITLLLPVCTKYFR